MQDVEQDSGVKYIAQGQVVEAIRRLMDVTAAGTAQSALIDFFVLKAKQVAPGAPMAIASAGETSVEPELSTYFRLVDDNTPGLVNPFGNGKGRVVDFQKAGSAALRFGGV